MTDTENFSREGWSQMATKVNKPIYRETSGGVFSRGKIRPVIVSVEPPNVVGFRLKGMHQTYYLTAEALFMSALQATLNEQKRMKQKKRKKRIESS